MSQSQTITLALLFFAILFLGLAQQSLTADLSTGSRSFFSSFQFDPGQQQAQNIEAAELERQCSLDCNQ